MQEDAVQAARSHGLRQRGGLPPAGAHRHVRQLRQADLPRGVRALNRYHVKNGEQPPPLRIEMLSLNFLFRQIVSLINITEKD